MQLVNIGLGILKILKDCWMMEKFFVGCSVKQKSWIVCVVHIYTGNTLSEEIRHIGIVKSKKN